MDMLLWDVRSPVRVAGCSRLASLARTVVISSAPIALSAEIAKEHRLLHLKKSRTLKMPLSCMLLRRGNHEEAQRYGS